LLGILETSPKDFFSDIGSKIYNQTNNTGGIGYIVENLFQENKEVYEKLIASKDDQIALLKSLLDNSTK
jgi:hypothetical protein